MTRLPKREARQQLLETVVTLIWLPIVALASLFIGPRYLHVRHWDGRHDELRGFSIVFGLIFYVPVYSLFMWRVKRRAARVEFRRKNGICVDCGYDLRGNTTGVCPECGEPVEQIKTAGDKKPI